MDKQKAVKKWTLIRDDSIECLRQIASRLEIYATWFGNEPYPPEFERMRLALSDQDAAARAARDYAIAQLEKI
jgi:hypothetical protein